MSFYFKDEKKIDLKNCDYPIDVISVNAIQNYWISLYF